MITADEYFKATGEHPKDDDLERVNCDKAGKLGHKQCGWNKSFNYPEFMLQSELDDFVKEYGR